MKQLSLGTNPEKIYDQILSLIDRLIEDVSEETDNNDILVAQEETVKLLTAFQETINKDYEQLKKNVEWNKFTIAFYGETNAGKSTIIDLLRILFKEQTKLLNISKFKQIAAEKNIRQEDFDKLRSLIIEKQDCKEKAIVDLNDYVVESENILTNLKHQLIEMQEKFVAEKATWSFWEKIWHYFKPSDAQIAIKDKDREFVKTEKDYKDNKLVREQTIENLDKNLTTLLDKENALKSECKLLEPYRDGEIIGDGRSDNTKINTSYSFNIGGNVFNIIDVPGIEGNESIVKESIFEAVQKAHAVFYVTRKPAAPQSGANNCGTLEKIKQHLGDQTEVWTIFNQPINSPARFNQPLISDDENGSLSEMNDVLITKLGDDHYKGEISISAYPAFLSVAECLVPGTSNIRNRKKFLQAKSMDEILEYCGINNFTNKLKYDITENSIKKIKQSNYNKSLSALYKAKELIDERTDSYKCLENSLASNARDAMRQINGAYRDFKNHVDNYGTDLVDAFENDVRDSMYSIIDDGLDNDDLEEQLTKVIKKYGRKLEENYKEKCNENINKFSEETKKIIENAKEKADLLIETNEVSFGYNITLDIDIDNGIDTKGLIASIGTAIALAFTGNPLAIAALAISLVISIYQAFRCFFSEDYKKQQQRKNTDENLRKIVKKLHLNLEKTQNSSYDNIEKDVLPKIEEDFNKIVRRVREIKKNLSSGSNKLNCIINEVKGEINNA